MEKARNKNKRKRVKYEKWDVYAECPCGGILHARFDFGNKVNQEHFEKALQKFCRDNIKHIE